MTILQVTFENGIHKNHIAADNEGMEIHKILCGDKPLQKKDRPQKYCVNSPCGTECISTSLSIFQMIGPT